MNACLQCLLPIDELRNHFLQQEYLGYKKRGVDRKRNNFDFCDKFNQFYSMVFTKSSKDKKWVLNPELKKIVRRSFDPLMQHDSHEFLVYLFEQLQDEQTPVFKEKFDGSDPKKTVQQVCEDYYRLNPSVIDKIFGGMMKTIVTCSRCEYASVTYNPFMTQSLGCKPTLEKSLHDVCVEHQIDGLYICEKCKKSSKAQVKHEIVKLPKILIFHMKRFDSEFHKIKSSVEFGTTLDMTR